MRSPDQVRKDLLESVNDSLASIRAIKGDDYAEIVSYLHMQLHTVRVFKILLARLAQSEPEADAVIKKALITYASMVYDGTQLLMKGFDLSESTLEEMLDWAHTLDSRMDDALKEMDHDR